MARGFDDPRGFADPPAFGEPPAFGDPPAFGELSAFGDPPAFDEPPAFGEPSAFGEPPAWRAGQVFDRRLWPTSPQALHLRRAVDDGADALPACWSPNVVSWDGDGDAPSVNEGADASSACWSLALRSSVKDSGNDLGCAGSHHDSGIEGGPSRFSGDGDEDAASDTDDCSCEPSPTVACCERSESKDIVLTHESSNTGFLLKTVKLLNARNLGHVTTNVRCRR